MTKPPKPPAEMAKTTTAVAQPASAKPAPPWPTQEKVKDLAAMLDSMYADAEAILKLVEQLEEATNDFSRRRILQEAEKVIEHFEVTGGRACFKSGRLQKLWNECYPDNWWSKEGGTPAYSQVVKMVTILMGSFPTSKIPEPDIFVRVLLDDLMEFYPGFVEMESTCRELRKKKKFMPSISEVIEMLEEQQKLWARRSNTMSIIEEFYDDLCAEVAQAKAADERKVISGTASMVERPQELPMAPIQAPDAVEVEDDDEF